MPISRCGSEWLWPYCCFCPFEAQGCFANSVLAYTGIGAVQLGLMYVFYYKSFELLSVPEVLVFTILTPVYVTLIHDAFELLQLDAFSLGACRCGRRCRNSLERH